MAQADRWIPENWRVSTCSNVRHRCVPFAISEENPVRRVYHKEGRKKVNLSCNVDRCTQWERGVCST